MSKKFNSGTSHPIIAPASGRPGALGAGAPPPNTRAIASATNPSATAGSNFFKENILATLASRQAREQNGEQ